MKLANNRGLSTEMASEARKETQGQHTQGNGKRHEHGRQGGLPTFRAILTVVLAVLNIATLALIVRVRRMKSTDIFTSLAEARGQHVVVPSEPESSTATDPASGLPAADIEGEKAFVCHQDCVVLQEEDSIAVLHRSELEDTSFGDDQSFTSGDQGSSPSSGPQLGLGGARTLKHAVKSYTSSSSSSTLSNTSPTVIFCDTSSGSITVTLPTAASVAETSSIVRYFTFVNKATSHTCTISTSSSESIHKNVLTTQWHDGSTYDRLYGGQTSSGNAGTDTTATFTPTSTISPYYVHTSQTLTVTTNYDSDAQSCCSTNVVASVSKSPVSIVTAIATSKTNVLNGVSYTPTTAIASIASSTRTVRTSINWNTQQTLNGITSYSTSIRWTSFTNDQIAICVSNYYARHSWNSASCPHANYQPVTFAYTYSDRNVVRWPSFSTPTNNRVQTIYVGDAPVVYSINAPSTNVVSNVQSTSTPVVSSAAVSGTSPIVHYPTFNTPSSSVLNSLPSMSSSATMTHANFAQTITGNIAVSNQYSVRSSTVVFGTISISDKTTSTSSSSIVLQPGSSVTLISDGSSAWYVAGGKHGQVTT